MKNDLKKTSYMAILWILIALVALTGVTFAWFSFTTSTNVTPMQGTVGNDGVNLLISNSKNGPFDTKCDLILSSDCKVLSPVSTADLRSFSVSTGQDPNGISTSYREIRDPEKRMLMGTVYLKSEDGACDLYFDRDRLGFGEDVQALAAMRFGIEVLTASGNHTWIFRLDDMADLGSAAKRPTTTRADSVVSGNTLVDDPAKALSAGSVKNDAPMNGARPLGRITAGETVTVNYYLYLEGCDINCINEVQSRDAELSLGFWGLE